MTDQQPQGAAVPPDPDAWQVSPVVQRLRSSQAVPAGRLVPRHCPFTSQASDPVHEFRSLQAVPSG